MKLALLESGPIHAPSIVFLHGGGVSARMWQPQMERLSEFHCLAPDLPEHGQSASVKPFTLKDATHRVGELIGEHSSSGKAHIVGLSLGGLVAQHLLATAPEMVDHMVISGTSMRMSRWMVALQGLNVPILRLLKPEQLESLLAAQYAIPSEYRPLLREDIRRFTPEAFGHVNQAYLEVETPMTATAPVLVAVGGKETLVAKRMAQSLVGAIPNARGVLAPNVGHVWNLHAPDLFAEMVRAWVSDQPLPSELLSLT